MTVLVIGGALLSISENFARLFGFLEALLRILVVGIAVGVILHRKAAIGLLDLYFRRRLGYVEYLVVVTFGHALISQTLETPILTARPRRYSWRVRGFTRTRRKVARSACKVRSLYEALRSLSLTSSNSASTTSSRPAVPCAPAPAAPAPAPGPPAPAPAPEPCSAA